MPSRSTVQEHVSTLFGNSMNIDLTRFALTNLKAEVVHEYGEVMLRCSYQCLDIQTREPKSIHVTTRLNSQALEYLPADFLNETVYRELCNMVLHELDECLHIDGKQLHDPHPEA